MVISSQLGRARLGAAQLGAHSTGTVSGPPVASINGTIPAFGASLAASATLSPRAHRYWRVYIHSTIQAYCAISELELRSTPGGPDLTGSGTPIASAFYGGFEPEKAFDNSTSSAWDTYPSYAPGQWLAYDFGDGLGEDIVEVVITPRTDGSHWQKAPAEFELQYSDDGYEWTTRCWFSWTWTNASQQVFSDNLGEGPAFRRWRIFIKRTGVGNGCSMGEVELRASVGGADETGAGTPSASYSSASYPASNAVNDDPATFWSSYSAGAPQWWAYDFGAGNEKNIIEWAITPRQDTQQDAPIDFEIQYGDDGVVWKSLWSIVGMAWPSAAQQFLNDINNALRLTSKVVEVWVRDEPGPIYVTHVLAEVWIRQYNYASVDSPTLLVALPSVEREATGAADSLTEIDAEVEYFDGRRAPPANVAAPTLVEAIPVRTAAPWAVISNTDIDVQFKLGGLAGGEARTVIAATPASRKVVAAAVVAATIVETDTDLGVDTGSAAVVSLTQIKCFPLLRAVTPACLTATEPPPPGGGGLRNYAM